MAYKKIINRIIAATGSICILGVISLNLIQPVETKALDNKIKNVIYLVADGMSDTTLTLARYFEDVKDGEIGNYSLNMDEIRVGFAKTNSLTGPITDSAAAGTALATGEKTLNGSVGVDENGKPIANLMEGAKLSGRATGLVSTSHSTDATPAAFSSHFSDRNEEDLLQKQQLNNDLDVCFSGNNDKEAVKELAKKEGYNVVTSKDELNKVNGGKVWGVFDTELDINREEFSKEQPSLAEQTKKAIEILEKDEDGFALMVEGSKIDWEGHSNQAIGMATETLAFDEAVKVALEYAKGRTDTMVVVTADHGNSGISIGNSDTSNGYDSLTFEDSVLNLAGIKVNEGKFKSLIKGKSDDEIKRLANHYMSLENLTDEELDLLKKEDINSVLAKRVKLGYTTKKHTGGDVFLGAYVPKGAQKLQGTKDNTEVLDFITTSLGINLDTTTNTLYNENIVTDLKNLGAEVTLEKNSGIDSALIAKKGHVEMTVLGNTNNVEIKVNDKVHTFETKGLNIIDNDKLYTNSEVVENFKKALESNVEVPNEEITATRIQGLNRYETAIEVAKKYQNGQKLKNVVISNSLNYADSLSATAFADSINAPILLTPSVHLNNSKTIEYIKANLDKDGKIYLLGGEGAVPTQFAENLKKYGFTNFERIGGKNRYETNLNIINKMNVKKGTPIFIANSTEFADSLSASSISAIKNMPIFLTQNNKISAETLNKIKEIAPSQIYVLGGDSAINDNVFRTLGSISKVKRLGGQNRYETSVNINKEFNLDTKNAVIANGLDFSDAISGSVLASSLNAPIILVNNTNNTIQKNYLDSTKINNINILGGTGAVSEETVKELIK